MDATTTARLTCAPVASIPLIRGRATGHGSDISLSCDMTFASREKAILSRWEVSVGMNQLLTASALLAAVLIATNSAGAEPLSPKTFSSVRPENLKFEPFPAFPPGAKLVVVVGEPSKPGPYVVRVTVPNGVKMMPHVHPEDRIYTVISGIFYIGLGNVFDPAKLIAYGPGSVVVLPANTPHFHWARSGDYTTQVNGYGPLGLRYVDPKDDPRNAEAPDP